MMGIDLLKEHEGFRNHVYECSAGFPTCGYGYNLFANPQNLNSLEIAYFHRNGISMKDAENLLINEVKRLEHELSHKFNWWSKLSEERQSVIINMAYNLGLDGLLKFKETLDFIQHGEYAQAADEMLRSKWAVQVKRRAIDLSFIMRTGHQA